MLVLSRKPGEKIIIGNGITVTVVEAVGNRVRIGIDAPDHVRILRGELAGWQEDSANARGPLDRAVKEKPNWSEEIDTGSDLITTV